VREGRACRSNSSALYCSLSAVLAVLRLLARLCPGLPAQLVRDERARRARSARRAWRRSACQASVGGCALLTALLLRAACVTFALRACAPRAQPCTRRSSRCCAG